MAKKHIFQIAIYNFQNVRGGELLREIVPNKYSSWNETVFKCVGREGAKSSPSTHTHIHIH